LNSAPVPRARQNMRRDGGVASSPGMPGAVGRFFRPLADAALEPPAAAGPVDLWGRVALWLLLAYYGWFYVGLAVSRSQTRVSVLDYILSMANLVFHEAGHIILAPLGSFMATLGGSLFQVLIPSICLIAFLRKRDAFAAAVMLWWTGQNLIDLAPYINDARAQRLVLLGGVTGRDVPGYHDWNNLLTRLDMLDWDATLASGADRLGGLLIIVALTWAGYLLWQVSSRPAYAPGPSD
jgi:hypothetical protein